MRIFTGQVPVYDPAAGRYVAVKGAALHIALLGRDAVTDADGHFLLSGLPAGDLDRTLTTAQSSMQLTTRFTGVFFERRDCFYRRQRMEERFHAETI